MATSLTVTATAYSIQTAKPSTQYGALSVIPFSNGKAGSLWRVALDKIPKNATITKATIRWNINAATSGTWTVSHYRLTGKWPSPITWAKRPTLTAKVASRSIANPKAGQAFDVDVTASIQAQVSGSTPNYGWYTSIDQTGTAKFRGSAATGGRPALLVTYTIPPAAPTNLQPSDAAVSLDKPTLLFTADTNILGLQVQVDPTGNATTPAFDSGDVPATGGIYDLATSSYPGLAAGATTYWRARQRTDGGWSAWTGWHQFARELRPTLTITSPAGTPDADGDIPVGDGTPPVTWAFDGTQVSYRARLLQADGAVLADSGHLTGADTDWTPAKGLTTAGQRGILEVTVWDDTARTATPGDPVETIAQVGIVLQPNLALEGYANVTASNDGWIPTVTITGHRSAIPDQVALVRDGAEVVRFNGTDVTQPDPAGGYVTTIADYRAVMRQTQTWALVPIVNGTKGPLGATVDLIPTCRGIWLTDTASIDEPGEAPEQVVVWTGEDQDQSQPETSVVHQPIGDGTITGGTRVPVVRRRLLRSAPQGTISGTLADVHGWTGRDMETRLRAWVAQDAGQHRILQLGGYTSEVIIGDVTFTETPLVDDLSVDARIVTVSLGWWAQ